MVLQGPDEIAAARRIWRAKWLANVHEFSNEETQRRLWLNPGDGSEVSTFDELYCRYFDNLGLWRGSACLVEEGYISSQEAVVVEPLHRMLKSYERASDNDAEILNDPKWAEVVAAAKMRGRRSWP